MPNLKTILFVGSFLVAVCLFAESDDAAPPLSWSGYVETYYAYDFGNPENHNRPPFLFSYNRHNEFNLNLGFIKASYNKDRVRANLALMAGTYTNANLSAEPGVLKNVFEANAGVKISADKNLWIDAGIFASHIGFESAVGRDGWNLTRSILAENSPYYESGAKISYTTQDGKWFLSGLILNGWQHIQRPDGNNTPAFGTQVTYRPNSAVTLNSSTFVGNDKPDEVKQMRYFHNFYAIFQLTPKIGATAGFDIGAEQKRHGSSHYNLWYSPVFILRYAATDKISVAGRAEYYRDKNGVIVATDTANGFKVSGYSLNLDYAPTDHVLWRIEGRGFHSKDKIFVQHGGLSSENFAITSCLAIAF